MTPKHFELLHSALCAAVLGAAVSSLAWLMTGGPPPWWVLLVISEAAYLLAAGVTSLRRIQEEYDLQAAFDRPAFGDEAGGVR